MRDVAEPAEHPLWQAVLDWLRRHPVAAEPWLRDRARIDETSAELFILGERPSVTDVRVYLAAAGASDEWGT